MTATDRPKSSGLLFSGIRWRQWWRSRSEVVAPWSLAVFRVCLGGLHLVLALRYFYYGWLDKYFIRPEFHFRYAGFEWVPVPGPFIVHAVFVLICLAALFVVAGLFYRWAVTLLFFLFTWFFLWDVTIYLNHYYLLALLTLLTIWLPADRAWALRPGGRPVRRFHLWLLRFQLGIVYFYGAVAKLKSDWLLDFQPVKIWLVSARDVALIGPLLQLPAAAGFIAWAGFLFDLTIVYWLTRKGIRTRLAAYGLVLVFHLATALMFEIGMFPWIMIFCTLVFFRPDWPRRLARFSIGLLGGQKRGPSGEGGAGSAVGRRLFGPGALPARDRRGNPPGKFFPVAISLFVAWQALWPLRHLVISGRDLSWSEEGFRFAWQIMIIRKRGFCEFTVDEAGKKSRVDPARELTNYQNLMMATQPDLVLQYARHLGEVRQKQSGGNPKVYARCPVSLNGGPVGLLVDPEVNLADQTWDWFRSQSWIRSRPGTTRLEKNQIP